MILTHLKKAAIVFSLILTIAGCKKINSYLDKAESGGMTEEIAFSSYQHISGFLADMYSGLFSNQWMVQGTRISYSNITDESYCPFGFPENQTYVNGTLTPSNNPLDKWAPCYKLIRKTNIFLSHIDHVNLAGADPEQIEALHRMKGEAYFIRAYANFQLFRRYGGVPIVDHVIESTENFNLPRNTEEEVVDFIVKDCDSATAILPLEQPNSELGRVTKGAAMMLKGKALLYFASPLHNPDNDVSRWKRAADASKAIMDLGIYHIDANYVNLFHTRHSSEIIFQSTVNYNGDAQGKWATWVGMLRDASWGNIQPTQNMVDAYEMKNGLAIDDANSGYDPQDPYKDRDPRLDFTIYRNGSVFKQRPNAAPVQTYVGGLDGIYGGPNINPKSVYYTQTGYNLGDKMSGPNSYLTPVPGSIGSHYWIFSRYGETLLNYAEAQNEALSSPDQSVYDAIDEIRARPDVNMPPLPMGLSKSEMRERIHNERRVEMAFENSRFWDVRRWKTGMQVFNAPIYGMWITKDVPSGVLTFAKFEVEKRVYKSAYNLFPIPQSEMDRNSALVQNPDY